MEVYEAILCNLLKQGTLKLELPEINIEQVANSFCCQSLLKIRNILTDDTLNDAECFTKIEEIIHVFESMGCSCGCRHDFG